MTSRCNGDGSLAAALKVAAEGSEVKSMGNSVIVNNATTVTIILTADTSFRSDNPESSVLKKLEAIGDICYDELYKAHIYDYSGLFGRVKLKLDDKSTENSLLPTNKRIEAFINDTRDNSLLELLFNFGRYLLISCSRKGSLPANLQGIWNSDFNPPWGSRYTININTQMNYWPAESCNLSECHQPLFDHIKRMRENGQKTARIMYNCGGFMAHHNTDIWGDTAPQDVCLSSTYWVMGAAWLCLHLNEHYLFTGDIDFLREYYPIMRAAADFILDFLIDDGEFLTICPTVSPENQYVLPSGEKGVSPAEFENKIC